MDTSSPADNLLSNIKGLIWSAFIGVVSFQILAPNVWDYLHEMLGLSYVWAYWMFTLVYFLLIPLCLVAWLWYNSELFVKYLPPFGDPDSDLGQGANAKRMLGWFTVAQIICSTILFFAHLPIIVYYLIWGVYGSICAYLLYRFSSIAFERINYPTGGLQSPPLPPNRKLVKYFWQVTLTSVLMYLLMFAVAFRMLEEWNSGEERNPVSAATKGSFSSGRRGFALLRLKDSIDKSNKDLQGLRDSLRYLHTPDTLRSIVQMTYYVPHEDGMDTTRGRGTGMNQFADSLLRWGKHVETLLKDLKGPSGEIPTDSIYAQAQAIRLIKPHLADSFRNTNEDLRYLGFLEGYLTAQSGRTEKVSQTLLGIQLRSVQAKGIILLISIFCTLLSLYIFLRINQRVQGQELVSLQKAAAVGMEVKTALSDQEDLSAESSSLSAILWLFLTIVVWLIIPIFKPVKDENINIKSPYKAFTFSSPASSRGNGNPATSAQKDTHYLKVLVPDTIRIVDSGAAKRLPPGQLQKIEDGIKELNKQIEDLKN